MAGMSKRHFEGLAKAIAEEVQFLKDFPGEAELADVAMDHLDNVGQRIADFCAKENPSFDRARFLKACGLEGEG